MKASPILKNPLQGKMHRSPPILITQEVEMITFSNYVHLFASHLFPVFDFYELNNFTMSSERQCQKNSLFGIQRFVWKKLLLSDGPG